MTGTTGAATRFKPTLLCMAWSAMIVAAAVQAAPAANPQDAAIPAPVTASPATFLPQPTPDDASEWVSLFDGRTLTGWEGDPTYWKVENGALVGQATPTTVKTKPTADTFIIWRGGRPADFELKLQYRVSPNGNGGVPYRSTEVSWAKWVMEGYQWDIDGADWWAPQNKVPGGIKRFTGQVWEDNNRTMLAMLGQICRITEGRKQVIGSVGDTDELIHIIHEGGWNDLRLIARGNELIHILNGRVTSIVIDDDLEDRRLEGELGLQVHTEAPIRIEYRDIWLRTLNR
jgi:hypothetical protein